MLPARTPWFPSSVKPVHVGWYEVWFGSDRTMRHWNGAEWRFYKCGPKSSFGLPHGLTGKWRGLAEPAKG